MYYGLVYYPKVNNKLINQIRKKYDPTVDLIEPHIGIMFPVPESVGEGELVRHIENVLRHWKPFPIRIRGFQKSWDHWLFLTLEEGNSDVIRLYRQIYTGILAKYRRDDIDFVPHITLGLFVKERTRYDFNNPQQLDFDEQKYRQALGEAEAPGLDFKCIVDKLHLVKLTDDFSRIVRSQEFPL